MKIFLLSFVFLMLASCGYTSSVKEHPREYCQSEGGVYSRDGNDDLCKFSQTDITCDAWEFQAGSCVAANDLCTNAGGDGYKLGKDGTHLNGCVFGLDFDDPTVKAAGYCPIGGLLTQECAAPGRWVIEKCLSEDMILLNAITGTNVDAKSDMVCPGGSGLAATPSSDASCGLIPYSPNSGGTASTLVINSKLICEVIVE